MKMALMIMFTSWKAVPVDEPGVQGLVGLWQQVVKVGTRGSRETEEGRQRGGGRAVLVVQGGRQHGVQTWRG